jgi:hypothetical protein
MYVYIYDRIERHIKLLSLSRCSRCLYALDPFNAGKKKQNKNQKEKKKTKKFATKQQQQKPAVRPLASTL